MDVVFLHDARRIIVAAVVAQMLLWWFDVGAVAQKSSRACAGFGLRVDPRVGLSGRSWLE